MKDKLIGLISARLLVTLTSIFCLTFYAKSSQVSGVSTFSDVQYVIGLIGIVGSYMGQRYFSDKKAL